MTTRTPLMAGNWKMNLDFKQGLSLVEDLGDALKAFDMSKVQVAVIPPAVDIRTSTSSPAPTRARSRAAC